MNLKPSVSRVRDYVLDGKTPADGTFHFRVSRPLAYGPKTPGHTRPDARQGYYINACDFQDAAEQVRKEIGVSDLEFDVQTWDSRLKGHTARVHIVQFQIKGEDGQMITFDHLTQYRALAHPNYNPIIFRNLELRISNGDNPKDCDYYEEGLRRWGEISLFGLISKVRTEGEEK